MRSNFYSNIDNIVNWWFGIEEEYDEEIEKDRNIGIIFAIILLIIHLSVCIYIVIK